MQAIGNRIIQTHPDLKVIYVSSEHFTNEFIKALKDGKLIEFKRTYRMTDVLLIDDIQFLENKERVFRRNFSTPLTTFTA